MRPSLHVNINLSYLDSFLNDGMILDAFWLPDAVPVMFILNQDPAVESYLRNNPVDNTTSFSLLNLQSHAVCVFWESVFMTSLFPKAQSTILCYYPS